MTGRIVCVWLPHWPVQRIQGEQPELKGHPIVFHGESGRAGQRVVEASPTACRAGVRPGMPLAEAQSLLSKKHRLRFEPDDPPADRAALQRLAEWCQGFSPLVGLEESDRPESLLLDVAGVPHLFGGERNLLAEVIRAFGSRGYHVRVGLADTIGAAWAVAHFGQRLPLVPPGRQHQLLGPLPIEALRLPSSVMARLHSVGIRHIGQLERLPRASLPSRFGPILLQRLDQAQGQHPESIVPHRPAEILEADWPLEYPTTSGSVLEALVRKLLEQIVPKLAERREGVLQLSCSLECGPGEEIVEGNSIHFSVELVQPSASVADLMELIRLRLERVTLPAPVSCVRLRADRTSPIRSHQQTLFENEQQSAHRRQFRTLLDRLSSRLGEAAVLRPCLCPGHCPEQAVRFEPVVGSDPRPMSGGTPSPSAGLAALRFPLVRPIRLKRQPVPVSVWSIVPDGPPLRLEWNGRTHVVARQWGAERIETGWWDHRDVRRDYYRIETDTGQRFWLFRRLPEGNWFLHGEFA